MQYFGFSLVLSQIHQNQQNADTLDTPLDSVRNFHLLIKICKTNEIFDDILMH